jgi:hypothetical protein
VVVGRGTAAAVAVLVVPAAALEVAAGALLLAALV